MNASWRCLLSSARCHVCSFLKIIPPPAFGPSWPPEMRFSVPPPASWHGSLGLRGFGPMNRWWIQKGLCWDVNPLWKGRLQTTSDGPYLLLYPICHVTRESLPHRIGGSCSHRFRGGATATQAVWIMHRRPKGVTVNL